MSYENFSSSTDDDRRNSSFSYEPNRLSGEGSQTRCPPGTTRRWLTTHGLPETRRRTCRRTASSDPLSEKRATYSLVAKDDVLYTGSDSKNIRVWKSMQEFSAFKSNSGLVKAINISGDRIFTGHQDGKIRAWRISPQNPNAYKQCGTMPTFSDIFKASIKPANYIETKRRWDEV